MGVPIKINLPAEHRFSCNSCGKCCSNSWRVRLTSDEVTRLASLEITQRLEREGYHPLEVRMSEADIALREDGSCPYHTNDGCDVHREVGGEKKPFTCQIFPFGAVNTPDGYFISTSFSCPAVLLGSGKPLREQEAELQRLLSDDEMYSEQVRRVRLTEERDLTWDEYKVLEEELLLRDSWADPVQATLETACWLVLHAGSNDIPTAIDRRVRETLTFREALNILPLFACHIISVLENPEHPEDRSLLLESLNTSGGHPSRIVEGAKLPPFEVAQVPNLIAQTVLDRYLEGQVFGKRLLVGPTVVTRILTLTCAVSVLLYYLNLRIQNESGPDMTLDLLEWAFELVETSLVTHAGDLAPLVVEFERAIVAYSSL